MYRSERVTFVSVFHFSASTLRASSPSLSVHLCGRSFLRREERTTEVSMPIRFYCVTVRARRASSLTATFDSRDSARPPSLRQSIAILSPPSHRFIYQPPIQFREVRKIQWLSNRSPIVNIDDAFVCFFLFEPDLALWT